MPHSKSDNHNNLRIIETIPLLPTNHQSQPLMRFELVMESTGDCTNKDDVSVRNNTHEPQALNLPKLVSTQVGEMQIALEGDV